MTTPISPTPHNVGREAAPATGADQGPAVPLSPADTGPQTFGILLSDGTLLPLQQTTPPTIPAAAPAPPAENGRSPMVTLILFALVLAAVVALVLGGWKIATAFGIVASAGFLADELRRRLLS